MNKIDKLKERLTYFVKEETSQTNIKIPNRVVCGFKLEIVGTVIQDLLKDKYNKDFKFVDYIEDDNGYIYNFNVNQ